MTCAVLCCQIPTQVRQHTSGNKQLAQACGMIPPRIARLVYHQDAKAVQDLRKHAGSIAEDSVLIASECKAIVGEYNQLMEDVHSGKYAEAVHALNSMIDNSEDIVRRVRDMNEQAKDSVAILKAAFPILFAMVSAAIWKLH